jgi:hypothetical protein
MLIALALVACDNNTDPRWQLHHDRIIAVRATPSHTLAEATTTLDAFITSFDAGPATVQPSSVAPASDLGGAVIAEQGGVWSVTAPTSEQLDALRTKESLAADAPVEVDVDVTVLVGMQQLVAIKQLWFGDSQDNPVVGTVTIDDAAASDPISVPFDVDVALAIDSQIDNRVNWLTSCGSLNSDDNEHAALLHVNPADPVTGAFAVVVRDPLGGVAWTSWQITTTNVTP